MRPTVTDGIAWSVHQLVCHGCPHCKNAKPFETLFGIWIWVGPRNHYQMGVQIPHARGQFSVEKVAARCKVRGFCAVNRGKTAVPIKMQVGMRSWAGLGNNILDLLHIGARGKYDWMVSVWRRCGLVSNYSRLITSVQTHLMTEFSGMSSELIMSYHGLIELGAKTSNGFTGWLPAWLNNLYRSNARPIIPWNRSTRTSLSEKNSLQQYTVTTNWRKSEWVGFNVPLNTL